MQKITKNSHKLYFRNLDSIRFIAALMVFLQHGISNSYKYLAIENTIWEKLLNSISNGESGVSIFFVLSGFLITYLLITEYETNLKISLKAFYMRRVLRIWPLYFLIIVIGFLIIPGLKSVAGLNHTLSSNILYHLTFLSNFDVMHVQLYSNGNDALVQNITWSVSIEEQFYLFWPLIFLLPKRYWLYLISFVIIGSLLFRILHYNEAGILYFHTFSVLLDLGIGGLIAYLIKENEKVKKFFENTSTGTHAIFILLSFTLIFLNSYLFDFKYAGAITRLFTSISFALVIGAQALTKSTSILNLRNITFANKWGKYTYGIYLIHPVAITIIDIIARSLHINATNFITSLLIGIAGFVLTLVLSKVSYIYFESQFLKLKMRFVKIHTEQ